MEFIMLDDDGERMTCKMPADETTVEVLMKDGTTRLATYHCDIMASGDWDFVSEEDPDSKSLSCEIAGWRAHPHTAPEGGER